MTRFGGLAARAGDPAARPGFGHRMAESRAQRRALALVSRPKIGCQNAEAIALLALADEVASRPVGKDIEAWAWEAAREELVAQLRGMAKDQPPPVKTASEALGDLAKAVRMLGRTGSNQARFRAAKEAIAHNLRQLAAQLNPEGPDHDPLHRY